MKLTDFAKEVCMIDGLKKQVNIAQVKEILKVVNKLLEGGLYKLVRNK